MRKIYGAGKNAGRRLSQGFFLRFLFFLAHQQNGKRRHGLLRVMELGDGHDRFPGKNMLGQFEPDIDATQYQSRQESRNQHAREQARQNHEEKIISRVECCQRDHQNPAQVNHSFTREFVVDLVGEPPQRSAPRQHRNNRQGHPARQRQRADSGKGPQENVAAIRSGESHQGHEKASPAGPVQAMPTAFVSRSKSSVRPSFEGFEVHGSDFPQRGTRVDSMISRRIASTCAVFFCVVA